MTVTDPLNLTGSKLGNYRLRKVLGRGNMGVVYLATDEALLRPTAVKVMTWAPTEHDPEAWFLAEARSVAKLNHPSVVQIYSVARHGPYCYIAMEYVEGVSAEVMITRQGPFSAERATEVILQLAAALELAHVSGIIHRDVKPGNILINSDGTAKLGDFGMAVSAMRDKKSTLRAGTPHYFAPEIWRGEPASVSTDVYALGATYYYLLAGKPPLDGSTIAGLSVAHQRQEVVAPPDVSAACMRVVRRCLAKSPTERYESARAVAWDARGVLRELASPWLAQTQTSSTRSRPDSMPPWPTMAEASPEWRARGFHHEPFASVDPNATPYRRAPFDTIHRDLTVRLGAAGSALALTGAAGSGRTVMARGVFSGAGSRGAYIDLEQPGGRQGSVIQRISRAFGAVASPTAAASAEIEGLLEVLSAAPSNERPPLIVIDGVTNSKAAAGIAMLARAARSTRYFSMLVVGQRDLVAELTGSDQSSTMIEMPPLTAPQVGGYIDGWLRAARAPDAAPLVVTADAALLIGHRADGNLARINALARQMIAGGGQVLTSWDAWITSEDAGEQQARQAALPARPTQWPTPEVLRLINQCRIAAGLAERPTLS